MTKLVEVCRPSYSLLANPLHISTQFYKAGTLTTSQWSCWASWSACTQTCGPTGTKRRHRVCVPGTDTSQPITCQGQDQMDQSCGNLPCPGDHCPVGFEFGVG